MDMIRIDNLKIMAHHGVLKEEKIHGQDFFLSAKLYVDARKAGRTDNLAHALDYADVSHFLKERFTRQSFNLIEAACEDCCEALLLHYDMLQEVELTVSKPHAPIGLSFENVSVTMTRKWHRVYLAIGSNMGDRKAYLLNGLEEVSNHPLIKNAKCSSIFETKPYGYTEQDMFLNGCIAIDTLLKEEELLTFLHQVEQHAGRERTVIWGPRTLDLDIIFYDREEYESKDLVIPHVDMQNRLFVLKPLEELCPNYRHPILGKTVRELLKEQERKEV